MRQFDVCRTPDGTLVVVLQHDLLETLQTRVVAPLRPFEQAFGLPQRLNPLVNVDGRTYAVQTQLAATLSVGELSTTSLSLEPYRDELVRSLDMVFTGI